MIGPRPRGQRGVLVTILMASPFRDPLGPPFDSHELSWSLIDSHGSSWILMDYHLDGRPRGNEGVWLPS